MKSNDDNKITMVDDLSCLPQKPIFDGIVQKLFDITLLRPVSDFPFSLQPLTNHLHLLGHGWYLLTGTRSLEHDAVSKEPLRACMILWAKNLSAAKLASRCEDPLIHSECNDNALPPVEPFMPTATGWSYGEILRAGRGKIMESAVYGASGEFQFKLLRLKNSRLHYLARTRKLSESPFAISLTGVTKSDSERRKVKGDAADAAH